MYYTIYKTTNKTNGKFYIGKHETKNINDSYMGSGRVLKDAIKKYGKENFIKEILFVFETREEMNQKEKDLITEDFVNRNDTYNVGVGGEGGSHFKNKKHTDETKQRLSLKAREQRHTLETRNKISENNKNREITDSFRLKMKKIATGRKKTEEERRKIGDARRRIALEKRLIRDKIEVNAG